MQRARIALVIATALILIVPGTAVADSGKRPSSSDGLFAEADWTVCPGDPSTCVDTHLEASAPVDRDGSLIGDRGSACVEQRPTNPPAHGTYYAYSACHDVGVAQSADGSSLSFTLAEDYVLAFPCSQDELDNPNTFGGCFAHGDFAGQGGLTATVTAIGPATHGSTTTTEHLGPCLDLVVRRTGLDRSASAVATMTGAWLTGSASELPATTRADLFDGVKMLRFIPTC